VLADRGYGKLKETHEHEHRGVVELTLAQVDARILEIVAGQKTNAKTTQVTAISRLTVHSQPSGPAAVWTSKVGDRYVPSKKGADENS
jgi:hypothetical protein